MLFQLRVDLAEELLLRVEPRLHPPRRLAQEVALEHAGRGREGVDEEILDDLPPLLHDPARGLVIQAPRVLVRRHEGHCAHVRFEQWLDPFRPDGLQRDPVVFQVQHPRRRRCRPGPDHRRGEIGHPGPEDQRVGEMPPDQRLAAVALGRVAHEGVEVGDQPADGEIRKDVAGEGVQRPGQEPLAMSGDQRDVIVQAAWPLLAMAPDTAGARVAPRDFSALAGRERADH